jgi:hypothetical protein
MRWEKAGEADHMVEIQITNPQSNSFWIEKNGKKAGVKWSHKSQKIADRFQAREGQLIVPREIPIKQFAQVLIIESGDPVFRGYVEGYKIDVLRGKTLTLAGMEKLLTYRYMPDTFFPAEDITLDKLFQDDCVLNESPGMLAIGNSMIPPGWAYEYANAANNTVKLTGFGTSSRLGSRDLYFIGYEYLRQISPQFGLSLLDYVDLTYFRNASDLWIRIDHNYSRSWPDRGGILCDGAFDTSVRLGACPTTLLKGDLQTYSGDDNVADLMTDLILSHELHPHIRDTKTNTFFDIDSLEGEPA